MCKVEQTSAGDAVYCVMFIKMISCAYVGDREIGMYYG